MSNAKRWLAAGYVAVALVAVTNTGCLALAAGAAAGGVAVAAASYHNGAVCQVYPGEVDAALQATLTSLQDLQMPLGHQEQSQAKAYVESQTGQGDKVRIYVEKHASPIPADGPFTRVCVRVGVFGDEGVSQRLHTLVAGRLLPPGGTPATTSSMVGPPRIVPTASPSTPSGSVPPQTAPPPLAN